MAQIFLSVDVQKTGTGNAAVAVPVPRFLQSGDFRKILVPVPVFHHIELKPAKFVHYYPQVAPTTRLWVLHQYGYLLRPP